MEVCIDCRVYSAPSFVAIGNGGTVFVPQRIVVRPLHQSSLRLARSDEEDSQTHLEALGGFRIFEGQVE